MANSPVTTGNGYTLFTNQELINGYSDDFARSITDSFARVTRDNRQLPFDATELYRQLFCFDTFDICSVEESFEKLIRDTPSAYEILKQAWLELVRTFSADLLMQSSHQLIDIRKLVDRISAYLDLLYDTYFEISKEFSYTRQHVPQSVPEELIEQFKHSDYHERKEGEHRLTLYTRFRGIPIERSCTVINASSNGVIFDVDKRMKAALTHGMGVAMIDCQSQHKTYRALYNPEISHDSGIGFSYLTALQARFRHQHIRVEPLFSTAVSLSGSIDEIDARLIDISDSGATLYCRSAAGEMLVEGAVLQMRLTLPSHLPAGEIQLNNEVHISRVINNYRKDPAAFRLSVDFTLSTHDDELLSSYIGMRQSEILAELNSLVERQ